MSTQAGFWHGLVVLNAVDSPIRYRPFKARSLETGTNRSISELLAGDGEVVG